MKQPFLPFYLCSAVYLVAGFKPLHHHGNGDPTFVVTIEQDGREYGSLNNVITIKPKPFDIVISMSEPMGVLVNASLSSRTFTKAVKGKHLDKLPGFKSTGMAEGLFNSDKELILAEDAPMYWFYDSDSLHRFNDVRKTETTIDCVRTIASLWDRETKAETALFAQSKPLYLVFVSYKWDGADQKTRTEIHRESITVRFE